MPPDRYKGQTLTIYFPNSSEYNRIIESAKAANNTKLSLYAREMIRRGMELLSIPSTGLQDAREELAGLKKELKEKLQWGHDFSAVEMEPQDVSLEESKEASMGPRLFSRGNIGPGQIDRHSHLRLQWGHDFSAVEIIYLHAGQPVNADYCFNGATTFQPWK